MHLAVIQSNHEVFEILLKQNPGNVDIRNAKFETPLHIVLNKLSNAATHLEMICTRNRISKANLLLEPQTKVAIKLKHASMFNIQAELRLKAIGE